MASGLKKSPAKFLMMAAGLVSAGVSIFGGMAAKKKARRERAKAQRELNRQKKAFKALDTSNLYEGVENPYASLQNRYTDMENVMEDLTVNQQQAQFQAQQQAQQRADVMQNLRGAAGGSGVAALAQTMASQQALGTQQISASIGQQEQRNIMAERQMAGQLQQQERQAAAGLDVRKAGGEWEAEQARLKGAEASRGLKYQKTQALMGMAAGQLSAAKQAEASAQQQITGGIGSAIGGVASGVASGMQNLAGGKNFMGGLSKASKGFLGEMEGNLGSISGDMVGSLTKGEYMEQLAGGLPGGGSWFGNLGNKYSDRRLKKNINLIGESPNGLNIYSFEYKDSKYGSGLFQGVMSDEVPQGAVSYTNEYDMVNYNMLDVEFKQI